jgi:hypothetical protein
VPITRRGSEQRSLRSGDSGNHPFGAHDDLPHRGFTTSNRPRRRYTHREAQIQQTRIGAGGRRGPKTRRVGDGQGTHDRLRLAAPHSIFVFGKGARCLPRRRNPAAERAKILLGLSGSFRTVFDPCRPFCSVDSFDTAGHVRMLDSAYWRGIESNREASCRSNLTILPLPTLRRPV